MAASRIITRLELTPEAKDRLGQTADRFGMTQLSMTNRMTAWFERQPESVQRAIMAGDTANAWRLVLDTMANGGKGKA